METGAFEEEVVTILGGHPLWIDRCMALRAWGSWLRVSLFPYFSITWGQSVHTFGLLSFLPCLRTALNLPALWFLFNCPTSRLWAWWIPVVRNSLGSSHQTWWHVPVMPARGRLNREVCCKFEASLGCIMNFRSVWVTTWDTEWMNGIIQSPVLWRVHWDPRSAALNRPCTAIL